MEPLVSVIIPCYNQAGFLAEAIESVLAQTLRSFEILVVDDGSTNPDAIAVLDALNYPQTRLIRQENRGLAGARNTGIRHARGTYILPLDADDKIGESYLEKAVAVLEKRPEVGIVYCLARFFGDRDDAWKLPDFDIENFLFSNTIFATALYRRADWEKAGGYDESLRSWEDFDLWLSFLERGAQVYRIPEELFYYRQHGESMLHQMDLREKYTKLQKVLAYMMEKHAPLYRAHLDAVARRVLPLPARPRHAKFRYRKYCLLHQVYGVLEKLPPLARWAGRKKAKSLWEKDLCAPER